MLSALSAPIYASLEDSQQREKTIPSKEMGDVKDRVAQESGENPEVEKLIGKKDAQEDDGRVSLDLSVFDEGTVGKKALKNVRTVQRRNGKEVKQPEPYVHQQHGDEYGEIKLRGEKKIPDEYPHHQSDSQVCKGSGQRDPQTAHSWVPEVPGVYGHWFGPSEIEEEEADRTEGIQMADRIQGDSTGHSGGGVAKEQRCTRMGILMDGYREKQHRDLDDPFGNLVKHSLPFFCQGAILTGIPYQDKG